MTALPELDRVDIVLVRPARGANVAAACRALKNMGVRRLTVVEPAGDIEAPEARALAYGAWDVLEERRTVGTLADAVAGAHVVVGTSGKEGEAAVSPRELPPIWAERGGGRLAVVFGPEASGLRSEELALCHARVRIPTDPAQPSLNLAQAVLIVAYELRLASLAGSYPVERPAAASAGELEAALGDLRAGLLAIGYLNPDNPDALLAELRTWLARAGPTSREVTLLRGMARQIRWAGARCVGADPGR